MKRSFEAHANTLEKKLANISDELEAAESEKAQLNKEIGRFIEVLKGKDAELKAAREQIEKHFVKERDEKAQLSDQVNDQKEYTSLSCLFFWIFGAMIVTVGVRLQEDRWTEE